MVNFNLMQQWFPTADSSDLQNGKVPATRVQWNLTTH
ncbi:hypothetical protein V1289_002442 [Bradyrhizobium sp. AZCC 2289]